MAISHLKSWGVGGFIPWWSLMWFQSVVEQTKKLNYFHKKWPQNRLRLCRIWCFVENTWGGGGGGHAPDSPRFQNFSVKSVPMPEVTYDWVCLSWSDPVQVTFDWVWLSWADPVQVTSDRVWLSWGDPVWVIYDWVWLSWGDPVWVTYDW